MSFTMVAMSTSAEAAVRLAHGVFRVVITVHDEGRKVPAATEDGIWNVIDVLVREVNLRTLVSPM